MDRIKLNFYERERLTDRERQRYVQTHAHGSHVKMKVGGDQMATLTSQEILKQEKRMKKFSLLSPGLPSSSVR